MAAKPTDEKSSAVFKRDYERTADDFCGKYVIAYYQPRQMRGLESRVGWYVGEGIFYLLSQTCIHSCSVPFAGLFAGLKLAGLGPAKCHAESPTKKLLRKNPNLDSQTLPSLFRCSGPYSGGIKEISIMIWLGKNRRSTSWEEFGSQSLNFCGAILFARLSAWHFAGPSPASFSPAKSPANQSSCNGISVLFVMCYQLTVSPHCILPVREHDGKQQLFIRTHTKKKREEDARVQDFREIYLLEYKEETSIVALQSCVQKGANQNDSICIHETNIDSANSMLEWIKGRTTQNPNRIAGPFVPGSIVWAKSGNIWWPARVSQVFFFLRFLQTACNHN